MTVHVPPWLLWTAGIVLGLIILALAVLGAAVLIAARSLPFF